MNMMMHVAVIVFWDVVVHLEFCVMYSYVQAMMTRVITFSSRYIIIYLEFTLLLSLFKIG
jgi:hypothetical protein